MRFPFPSRRTPRLRGALLSLCCLPLGLAAAFPLFAVVDHFLPGVAFRVGPWFFFSFMAVTCGVAGAAWVQLVAGREAAGGRLAAARLGGALGYGSTAALSMALLNRGETELFALARAGSPLPMHLAFATLFGAVVLLVVFGTTAATALGLGAGADAIPLGARIGMAATASFLAVVAAMDLIGWRVGGPGAEARFTMLVVTGIGLFAATSVAGAMVPSALLAASVTRATQVNGETADPVRAA